MQLTIDSSEPLSQVTTVVGALYGVDLVVSGSQPAGEPAHNGRRRKAAIAASKTARRSAGRARRNGKRVDAAVVRQWAVEHGIAVSNRGQLPKSVLAAYNEQQG